MIYGEDDSVFKIFCSERAIEAHCQGFFGNEPLSEFTQGAAFARARLRQTFRFLDSGQGLFMGWMVAQLFFRRVNGIRQRVPHQHQTDNHGKHARAEAATWMSVGKRREFAAGCKNVRVETV